MDMHIITAAELPPEILTKIFEDPECFHTLISQVILLNDLCFSRARNSGTGPFRDRSDQYDTLTHLNYSRGVRRLEEDMHLDLSFWLRLKFNSRHGVGSTCVFYQDQACSIPVVWDLRSFPKAAWHAGYIELAVEAKRHLDEIAFRSSPLGNLYIDI
jgi:hypothetical protein